jgi:type 2 lantibiotic biosynthesis protein LanM
LTSEQRQILRRIANRATPLWERVPSASGRFERRHLERWCEVLGSGELLERRMRSTPGLTAEELLSGTGPARLPGWSRTLATVLFESPTVPSGQLAGVPFEEILDPFLCHARRRFRVEARSTLRVLSPAAVEAIERELLEHLALVASLALGRMFYEFRFMRAPLAAFEENWAQQPRSTAIYSDFVARLRRDGLVDVFERYPVLGRLLAQSVDLWVEASARLCRRFAADWPRLRKFFGWTEGGLEGAISGLKTGLSDRHRGGQTVAELSLATGDCIIYKPRSVRPELAFNAFLNWLNDRDLPLRLGTVRALDRETYGWMEVVPHRRCEDAFAVERFYVRAGMLLAVLHALAVTDIHCENLIASGEHPVVVDLETLLSESPRRRVTVLDTGFLPRRPNTNESAVDVSALGADDTPDSELRFPMWRQINTDQMSLSEGTPREREFHRVQMGDQMPTVAEHLSSFRQGFRAAYECVLAHRRSLAREPSLKTFDGLELRVLLRDSATYGQLQLHLLHPEFLEDAIDRSIELEWLARPLCIRTKPLRGRANVYELERAAMEQLDLPHFNTSAWHAMQHHPATDEAKVFGGKRDSRTLRRRLAGLSRTACRRQLALMTRSVRLKYPAVR